MVALAGTALLLAAGDDVAVCVRDVPAGTDLELPDGTVARTAAVPRGHKVAVRAVAAGEPVHKYGQVIGTATAPIAPGEHVHVHNLGFTDHGGDRPVGTSLRGRRPPAQVPTFLGYRRADGRVGTRNHVAVLASVNCSSAVARLVADAFPGDDPGGYPGVDGVVALAHTGGCGQVTGSTGAETLLRTLRGTARHANVGGLVVIGLGCEMVPVEAVLAGLDLPADTLVATVGIQESGGVRAAVRAGTAAVRAMLPELDRRVRVECPVSDLVLGLNCGGSDGYSGLTANPALGVASDLVVDAGGASVLAETPEVFGAEHLLTARAPDPAVAARLLERIDWWREHARIGGGTLDANPSPGNKAGGLTTILEKSLGAVAKAGHSDLASVLEYAEPVAGPGLAFMDTPGYDPVSVTGIVAGGATVVCFTTGRGSVLSSRPAPVVKLASNTELFRRMPEEMDLDCGRVVSEGLPVEQMGREVFDLVLAVASGRRTAGEELGLGREEFVPWQPGIVT